MIRRGFTLVETIVALVIFTLMMGGIFHILDIELVLWDRLVSSAENQQTANIILSRIVRDIRSPDEVSPASGSKELVLKTADGTVEYALLNNKVRRKQGAYSSYLTAEGALQRLSFFYPSAKIVEIRIENLVAGVYLRN